MPSVFDPLVELSRQPMSQDDFTFIINILHNSEVDSVVAISGAALLEAAVTQVLLSRLRESKTGNRALFRGNAPLSSFSSITQMAFALNVFGKEYRHDIDGVRHIRNAFAHSPKELKFATKAISDVCDTFYALRVAPKFNEAPTTARDKFSFTVRTVGMFLILASAERMTPPEPELP